MARLYGRGVGTVPHGHGQSSTFLAALRIGDVVIPDNLSTHMIANVAPLLAARGASVRYLPPYSPDLNPIELAFAMLKAHLRRAAARILAKLQAAVAHGLTTFSPAHCQGCLLLLP